MWKQLLTLLPLAAAAAAQGLKLNIPPPQPASYPPLDQTLFITGQYLQDPLVVDAVNYVKSVVPDQLWNLPVSNYILYSNVTYRGDPVANCYWPGTLCVRKTDTAYYKADVWTCPDNNTWGISFDDGPTVDPVNHYDSVSIRAQLDAMNIKSTFFIVGVNAAINPSVLLDEYRAGYQIGVHTWTHHPLTALSNEQIVAEIKYTEAIIYNATGQVPRFFRPPYGDIDDRVRAIVGALGYVITLWNADDFAADQATQDSATGAAVFNNFVKTWFNPNQHSGLISLSHDINPFTSSVALNILKWAQDNKLQSTFKIVPVGTCVNIPWYQLNSTLPNGPSSSASLPSPSSSAPAPPPTAAAPAPLHNANGASTLRWQAAALVVVALVTMLAL
ncbi:uncharacterized protein BJ171DRAFT_484948 [Polychytrium aggregatum]|uniref:uncharacterized protein n=1 Tax=Polychytrium aggregatum TaxID=110093 RepID=UPI0022FE1346|nr:uncharacterized protein BJ171DRAFT_484948 [Polychytrium aggregatum]KAI9209770.1 hypothetical protein BJ171DRAFT_484948 [Polychytrium aggregatum]